MGWDDNGLPTERRVQNYYGVRCDPSLPYVEGFEPPHFDGTRAAGKSTKAADQLPISPPQLHRAVRAPDGRGREGVRGAVAAPRAERRLVAHLPDDLPRGPGRRPAGVPAEPRARRGVPGRGADAVGRHVPHGGRAGRARGARTAGRVPPARVPARSPRRRGDVFIETTRPELLPACVALVAHPDDERYQPLFGTTVRTPLFDVEVPVVAHYLASPDKGSGIAMICTFGDMTDVTWWRELQLETRPMLGWDGRVLSEPPPGIETRGRPRGLRRARGQDRSTPRRSGSSSCCASPAPWWVSRRPSRTRSSSSRRATSRSRSSRRASGTSRTAAGTRRSTRRSVARGEELGFTPTSCACGTRTG